MIKKNFFALVILALFFVTQSIAANTPYEIHVRIAGVKDTNLILAHHFADQKYVDDTIRVGHDGWGVFKGDSLEGGIYLIATPNMNYFEIIISEKEPKFTIENDPADWVKNFKCTGSQENNVFYEYLRYITVNNIAIQSLKPRLEANKDKKDSTEYYSKKIAALQKLNTDFVKTEIAKYPNLFISKLLNMMRDVEIPESPKNPDGTQVDSFFAYKYNRAHFWDNTDFSDHRILRTPVLQSKIDYYIEKLTSPDPDSIIVATDIIINKAKADREVFRYVVLTMTHKYETSQIMCQEKIFVSLAQKYYLSGMAYWADTATMRKIKDRVNILKLCDCGATMIDMNLPDSSGVYHQLSAMKNDFVVVFFYADDCSHCKEVTPHMDSLYKVFSKKGIGFYAVDINDKRKEWIKFSNDNHMTWINVWDPNRTANFRWYYDVYSTPVIYVLDKNKKILGKRIDYKQLGGYLDHLLDVQKKLQK